MNLKSEVLSALENKCGQYQSGAELSALLSVSRDAVWKAVKALQEEGFIIDSVPNKGYALDSASNVLSAEGIQAQLAFFRKQTATADTAAPTGIIDSTPVPTTTADAVTSTDTTDYTPAPTATTDTDIPARTINSTLTSTVTADTVNPASTTDNTLTPTVMSDPDIPSSITLSTYGGHHISYTFDIRKSVTSTNTVLKQLASEGLPEGYVLMAEMQTAGKGRLGRSFYSPASTGIYMSILLRPKLPAQKAIYITTAAAVAVSEAVEEVTALKVGIKWVNDIFCNGKKICGILTEASFNLEGGGLEYAVLGIGINVDTPENGFPDDISHIAGALKNSFPDDISHIAGALKKNFSDETTHIAGALKKNSSDETPHIAGTLGSISSHNLRSRLAASVLTHFEHYYCSLADKRFLEGYRNRSILIGRSVSVLSCSSSRPATVLGIDDEFHLQVRYEDGAEETLSTGEVSIRLT